MKKLTLLLAAVFLSFNSFTQSCLPEGIQFSTQAQIDSFQSDYPGCTSIEGEVEINGDDITNVDGLSVITSIGNSLYITGNLELNNLSGLAFLNSVSGSLLISSNQSMTNLNGLDNIVSLGGDVFISSNPVLTDIAAIGNIDPETVSQLWITNNASLATCNIPFICDYLADPNGVVNIHDNAPGCNDINEIAEACAITLPCLPFGNYYFYSQADIDNFQSLYPGCTDLEGLVHIEGEDINDLAGLNVIQTINGSLEIRNNILLASLDGLDSLLSIQGSLTISGNSVLTDISALSQLDTAGITFIAITNNPVLSECQIESVCNYLFGTFGWSHNNFNNNDDGCKNKDEVMLACTVGVREMPVRESYLHISPNPASDKITIETQIPSAIQSSTFNLQLSIFNYNGQKVMQLTIDKPQTVIDIHHLPGGVYFVRWIGVGTSSVEKFVKID